MLNKLWTAWKNEQLRGKRRWAPTYKRLPFNWAYYAKMSLMFFLIGAFSEIGLISAGYYKVNLNSLEEIDKAIHKHKESMLFMEELGKNARRIREEKEAKLSKEANSS